MRIKRLCSQCGRFGDFYSGYKVCRNCVLNNAKGKLKRPKTKKDAVRNIISEIREKPITKDTDMRILWLYRYIEDYDYDNWLHLKFVEYLKGYPGVELLAYGPDIHVGYPHLTTLPYDPKITIDDIKKHFDFDVIILNTKSRMFMHYNPHSKEAQGEWLPPGYCFVDKPRIVIEEDYHYETDDSWYAGNRIDLILQRHYSQSLRKQNVPMQWFPFSVDTSIFRPDPSITRENKICFAGSINSSVYKPRHFACDALMKARMLNMYPNGKKEGMAYVVCLRSWVSHLSCSSIYKLSSAKMFEIMASGSALFTNENDDLPLLFTPGSYFTYRNDNSNTTQIAREIISNKSLRESVVKAGMDCINARHSHQVRIGELINIINSLKNGK